MRPLLQDFAALAWKLIAQAVVLGLAFVAHQAAAAVFANFDEASDDVIERMDLHLAEDQYEVESAFPWAIPMAGNCCTFFGTVDLGLSAAPRRGVFEMEISLGVSDFADGSAVWELILIEKRGSSLLPTERRIAATKDDPKMVYREVLHGHEIPKEFFVVMKMHALDDSSAEPYADILSEDFRNTLNVKLRRVDYCTMWARVTGDVDLITYGDVAYFNAFAQPTTVATGSMFDPEMIDMIGDMAEGMGEMGVGSTDDGEDSASSGSAARRDWEDFVRQESEGGTENWGVSMVDARTDSDPSALGTMLGGMTIEAAGPGSIVMDEGTTYLTLSRLDVVPGKFDLSGDRIKFTWREGEPGAGHLVIFDIREDSDFISGTLGGELYSEKTYDGRKLRITVEARFAALRGAMSCR